MYTFESRVRYSEIGEDKTLSLIGLLNYLQDCTTFHSESMGRGVDTLEAIHRAWVLTSWQVCVNRCPGMGEKINISTWPYAFKGFYGARNFTITTEQGEVLAYANSLWAFIDIESGKPVKIEPEEYEVYKLEEKLDMDYAPRKIVLPKENQIMEAFSVKRHHLDTNHHVNNAQYIRLAQDYIPQDFVVHQMRAEYKSQAVLGDVMIPVVTIGDGICTVALCNEENRPYAVVEFS
ncbi:MAG: acyl-[acyl-carrier-protein] thioesterase [Clostridia bacterium]|nr:acyl-[acyl-carrier-protein] thioesterase [Clostridia bacterium]NCC44515.1 acyl-[acyl-carrier-protein] thioesterase [Clostridia bacterium]